jgi:hypothetical protein
MAGFIDRLAVIFPFEEPIFNAHPAVRRTALIGLGEPGRARPAVVVEPLDPSGVNDSAACRALGRELRVRGQACPTTTGLRTFFFHPGFPVDVRHNAKIHRLTLAAWARTATGYDLEEKR